MYKLKFRKIINFNFNLLTFPKFPKKSFSKKSYLEFLDKVTIKAVKSVIAKYSFCFEEKIILLAL